MGGLRGSFPEDLYYEITCKLQINGVPLLHSTMNLFREGEKEARLVSVLHIIFRIQQREDKYKDKDKDKDTDKDEDKEARLVGGLHIFRIQQRIGEAAASSVKFAMLTLNSIF